MIAKLELGTEHHMEATILSTSFWLAVLAAAMVSGDVDAPPKVCIFYVAGLAGIRVAVLATSILPQSTLM